MTDENQTQNDAEELEKYIEMYDERYQTLYKDDYDNVATGYITDTETDWIACVTWHTNSYPKQGPRTYRVQQWIDPSDGDHLDAIKHVRGDEAATDQARDWAAGEPDAVLDYVFCRDNHPPDSLEFYSGAIEMSYSEGGPRSTVAVVFDGVEPTSDD